MTPRTIRLTARPADAGSWAPYGQIPRDETDPGNDTVISFQWCDPHVNFIGHDFGEIRHNGTAAICDLLNRHDTATQTLMPMNVAALVVVAPAGLDFSEPAHLDQTEAFVLRPLDCVNLAVGTWHWGPYPLAPGRVRLLNIQGRRYAEDNKVVYLERDLGVVIEATAAQ
jgi:ureidoglycolate hydrolase